MDITDALAGLAALAHEGRLSVFRLLVSHGPDGLAAGEIVSNAGLILARREGRSIIYAADFEKMSALLQFLTRDCCGGRPEICAPLAATVNACCPPKKRRA